MRPSCCSTQVAGVDLVNVGHLEDSPERLRNAEFIRHRPAQSAQRLTGVARCSLARPEAQRLPDPAATRPPSWPLCSSEFGAASTGPRCRRRPRRGSKPRAHPGAVLALESLLREYPISSSEGLALMRLAESLLRVPDTPTAVALTADQLGRAALIPTATALQAVGRAGQLGHPVLRNCCLARRTKAACSSASGRRPWWPPPCAPSSCWAGSSCSGAASLKRRLKPLQRVARHALRFSFDMLGEGARTEADAERYLASYAAALRASRPSQTLQQRGADQLHRVVQALLQTPQRRHDVDFVVGQVGAEREAWQQALLSVKVQLGVQGLGRVVTPALGQLPVGLQLAVGLGGCHQFALETRVGNAQQALDDLGIAHWPRRSATPYSVTTRSRRWRGMVQWPYCQTMLLTGPCAVSWQARRIRMERASGSACAIATKLYCPPTPLTTWPDSSASEAAAPSKVTFIVVLMKRP